MILSLASGAETAAPVGRKKVLGKLKSILIEKLAFENTPLLDAVRELAAKAREADTPSREGVNLVPGFLKSSKGAEKGAQVASVTLSLSKVSLYAALQHFCEVTNLKMRVEEDGVVLVAADEVEDSVQMRMYDVAPGVYGSLTNVLGADGANAKGGFQR